jgi:hypothetical protein
MPAIRPAKARDLECAYMPMVEPQNDASIPPALIDLAAAMIGIVRGFDDRATRILAERILATAAPLTLEELGKEFSLTRERVRQIEVRVREKIEKRLRFPDFQGLVRAANSLAGQLGVAFPEEHLSETASLFATSAVTAQNRLLLPLLLWVGGPYERDGGWVLKKPASATLAILSAILPQTASISKFEDLSLQFTELGVRTQYHERLIAYLGCRLIDGFVLQWRGSLADKAFSLLSISGHPLTRDQISSSIPEEHSIRTLGNYLYYDERFSRVNLTKFGLSSWGASPYKGIIQELTDEIGHAGGEATLSHLRATLIQKFGVSESSIVSYLNSPLFAKTTSGGFRVRRDDEEIVVQSRVDLTRSCFRIGERWAFRLQIDDELIRGSGRNIPSGFAQAIGVAPGTEKCFHSKCGEYRIAWFGPQPIVGSVRKFIEQHSLRRDDWIYLAPNGNFIQVEVLRAHDLHRLDNISRLCLETCPWKSPDIENSMPAIAEAIGINTEQTSWTAIKRRFLERRESCLLALVPDESSEEHDNASLSDLFQYIR